MWNKCECCGGLFVSESSFAIAGTQGQGPPVCTTCDRRGRLCMHNAFNRYAEEGDEFRMHSSKPHHDASGADDPKKCRWCRESTVTI